MTREPLVSEIRELGFSLQNYRVLKLLPLIHVAWADARMERVEIESILKVAVDHFYLDESGRRILAAWLKEPPTKAYVLRGLRLLLELAHDEHALQIDPSELFEILMHAESVARATEDAFNEATAVTEEERAAISEIAELLGVDAGVTWSALLEEVSSLRGSTLAAAR